MSTNKVWFHTGTPCHGCAGIGDMWRKLAAAGVPFAAYAVESAGLIVEASAMPSATLIYRSLATDVADYGLSSAAAARRTWSMLMSVLPPEIMALKDRVWIEIGNEQDKTRADWLGWYYVELAGYAAAGGYRICGPGWATGEPEPADWETPGWMAFLRLCAARPDRLAITVHEYSLDADSISAGAGWLVGRVKFLFDACERHGIWPPAVFVTEAGWTHNDLPPHERAKADIEVLARVYAAYPTVRAAFLWTLIGGGDKKTLAAELNALMPWLTDWAIATDLGGPPPIEPPPGGGEPMPTNLLGNPSFEDGWKNATEFPGQHPKGWEVEWNTGPAGTGYDYSIGEGVHKSRGMLPPVEQPVFVWDGNWAYKAFAGNRAIWPRLKQTVDLPAGRYRLTTPVWTDCYHWEGGKDYNLDPEHIRWFVRLDGTVTLGERFLTAGKRQTPAVEFEHDGGPLDIAVHFQCRWPVASNNLWLDGWSLEAVAVTPPPVDPPPVAHKAIVVKLPQDMTAAEWARAAEYAYQYRHTMTASHDDMMTILQGGNAQSYVKLAYPARQLESAALITAAGYRWEALDLGGTPPPFPG